LNWQCSYGEGGNVILSPIPKDNKAQSTLHEYMKTIDKMQNHHERMRVFYVAATRAKTSLHLFGQATTETAPSSNSFLGMLWPRLDTAPHTTVEWEHSKPVPVPQTLANSSRLALSTMEKLASTVPSYHILSPDPASLSLVEDRIIIGNIVHLYLERIANLHQEIASISCDKVTHDLSILLAESPLPLMQYIPAKQEIQKIIQRCLECPTLQDILSPTHKAAHNEYAVTAYSYGQAKRYIIDRTYIDQHNKRWIIDYKTSLSPQERPERYAQQLHQYAELFTDREEEIWLGLYYPTTGDFDYWHYKIKP